MIIQSDSDGVSSSSESYVNNAPTLARKGKRPKVADDAKKRSPSTEEPPKKGTSKRKVASSRPLAVETSKPKPSRDPAKSLDLRKKQTRDLLNGISVSSLVEPPAKRAKLSEEAKCARISQKSSVQEVDELWQNTQTPENTRDHPTGGKQDGNAKRISKDETDTAHATLRLYTMQEALRVLNADYQQVNDITSRAEQSRQEGRIADSLAELSQGISVRKRVNLPQQS